MGYASAAHADFEAPPYWSFAHRPYPLGIPRRVLYDKPEMERLFGCIPECPPAQVLVTVPSMHAMTQSDMRVLAVPNRDAQAFTLRNCSVPFCDPKIVEADAHAADMERRQRLAT